MKLNVTSQEVFCRVWILGFHNWPDAPDEVEHLRERHRHLFKFFIASRISHSDRDIEFQLLQKYAGQMMDRIWVRGSLGYELGYRSVEMMAEELAFELHREYQFSIAWIEVWEDEENGCRIEFEETD